MALSLQSQARIARRNLAPRQAGRVMAMDVNVIPPRSGCAFEMKAGEYLTVIDAEGGQVADLLSISKSDVREMLSSGRTLDYAERIYLSVGNKLYSNRSNVMLEIVEDTVGRHDFLLTPCSEATFRIGRAHV